VENLAAADCPAERCLIVEEGSTYCSIDPVSLKEGRIFTPKSRLTIRAGVYPVSGGSAIPGLTARLKSGHGEAEVSPTAEVVARVRPTKLSEDGGVYQLERVEIIGPYVGDGVRLDKFFLRTPRWPHAHFRLGDPEDLFWFFWVQRNLFIRVAGGSALFPGLSDETILYAPCAMRGQPDETFAFGFADGSNLTLSVRAVSGTREIGYYTGRLFAAAGRVAGEPVDVRDPWRLAFFGSTRSWAEMAIPIFAVRTAESGESCGFILDSTDWDTPRALNGYIAYRMTCDERRGEPIPLRSVTYPPRYSLP
jgi:hypothetical protein